MIMFTCIKEYLRNFLLSTDEKLRNIEAELKKALLLRKSVQDIFVFKMAQNLEQLRLADSIHSENSKNNKGVLGIIIS